MICSISFYQKHFLIFFDVFVVLLNLLEAGGQLIDINVHWEFNLLFPMRLYLIIIHSGFQCKYRNWSWNYTCILYFLHLCNFYNYKTVIFVKLRIKSWFLDDFIQIKENIGHPFCTYCPLSYLLFYTVKHSIYFECSIFLHTFLSIIQTLKCFL